MKRISYWGVLLAAMAIVAVRGEARAEDQDVTGYYEIKTDGTSQKVKSGAKGTLVLAIKTKSGAHISDEAPLKVELAGDKVKPEKAKLSRADSISKKEPGQEFADPRFEVPFTAEAAGQGKLDAKLTFFVCTLNVCARQQKTVSLPVEVQ